MSMKTKNTYSYPVEESYIKKIITNSPAHIIHHSKKFNAMCDLTHAVDFICDEGTPIKAALDGEIVTLVDDIKENYSGLGKPIEEVLSEEKQDGNYVIIKHVNKEFSIYSHFKYKKVIVKRGQIVKTGEIIGYSGNTGWSTMPHLHFMVLRFIKPLPARDFESLEIRWS